MAHAIGYWLKEALMKTTIRKTGAVLAQNAFRDLKEVSNYEEYGGAPLLGINGICIIGHGASTPRAVFNAIRVADSFARNSMPEMISKRIYECGVPFEGHMHEHGDIPADSVVTAAPKQK